MKYSIKHWLVLALFISFKGFSQEVAKGLELMEIVKISETYRLAPDISFNMSFTYADSTRPNTILEQINGTYKIHNGKYWGMLDSIEYLQGGLYNLAIYHKDSVIAINNRQEYASVLQIPVMDSLFRQANVAKMGVTKLNDSTRSLTIIFTPQAAYRSYELQYDLNNFLIRKVKYYLPDAGSDNINSSGVVCVTINFSNYSSQALGEEHFNENRFVYRQNDDIVAQPAFRGFRIINNSNQQGQ